MTDCFDCNYYVICTDMYKKYNKIIGFCPLNLDHPRDKLIENTNYGSITNTLDSIQDPKMYLTSDRTNYTGE